MTNPETHTCPDCGYVWKHGQHGGHSCVARLKEQVAELTRERDEWKTKFDAMLTVEAKLRDLLKAQAGEQKYICDQIPHPKTVPCVYCQPLPSTPAAEAAKPVCFGLDDCSSHSLSVCSVRDECGKKANETR